MSSLKKLQEVLSLVRATGDKVIIMDQENEPYVVMDLANYRTLLREESSVAKLTEEELLEKINRMVSSWKSTQPDLADYDLAQFRVDSIRKEPETPKVPQTYIPMNQTPREERLARHDELLAQVIDTTHQPLAEEAHQQLVEDEDDKYYPEPQNLPIL